MARCRIGIKGLTEARIPGSGDLQVEDYLLLHSGDSQHTNGVALLLRAPYSKALALWKPISDRLLHARLKHRHGHMTIVVAYAPLTPTELADDPTKDNFYNQLAAIVQSVPLHDILVVLGDLYAVSGRL